MIELWVGLCVLGALIVWGAYVAEKSAERANDVIARRRRAEIERAKHARKMRALRS